MTSVSYDDAIRSMVDGKPQIGLDMFEDALNALFRGDVAEGRIHLREFVASTIGFAELGRQLNKDPKNLMRSLSPRGNPTASNLFEIIQACTKAEGVTVTAHVQAVQPHVSSPGLVPPGCRAMQAQN